MTVRMGADDVDFFNSPREDLLKEITGLDPEPSGAYVLLDEHLGTTSTQRFALADLGGGIEAALWPGETKAQAMYLYSAGRAATMIEAAQSCGWRVTASPHLAFLNSYARQRLYMTPDIDPLVYAERWADEDREFIGRHPREDLEDTIWPWLMNRGYASAQDKRELEAFVVQLGRRPVDVRPGMRFRQRWEASAVRNRAEFISAVRRDVNLILAAAGEPTLRAPA